MRREDYCPVCQMDYDLCEGLGCLGDGEGAHVTALDVSLLLTGVAMAPPAGTPQLMEPAPGLKSYTEPVELVEKLQADLRRLIAEKEAEFAKP